MQNKLTASAPSHADLCEVVQTHLVDHAPAVRGSRVVVPSVLSIDLRTMADHQHSANTCVAARVEPT